MDLIPGRSVLGRFVLLCLFLCPGGNAQTQTPIEAAQASSTMQSASIHGIVKDADEALIATAQIQVETSAGIVKTASGGDGSFSFIGMPAGSFTLTITASGFATKVIAGTLQVGEAYEVSAFELTAATNVDVQVILSQHDVA